MAMQSESFFNWNAMQLVRLCNKFRHMVDLGLKCISVLKVYNLWAYLVAKQQ